MLKSTVADPSLLHIPSLGRETEKYPDNSYQPP